MLDGLYWLVADLAEEMPLLITIDDAQWADEPSLRHLAYLCRRVDGVRAALLVAVRSGEPPRGLLAELGVGAAKTIEPAPLSSAGVAKMVRRTLGHVSSPRFASTCLRQTGGYPLYLVELLREAQDACIEPTDAAAEKLEDLDAERLAQHVWSRIEAVGEDATTVVGLVSALGSGAVVGRIARLGELPPARVAELVEELAGKGVLVEGEPPRFTHPVVRASVDRGLPAAQLDGWHRGAARLLHREGADVREVAAHLTRCHPDGDLWAAEQLRQSARMVLGHGAPEAAALELRRALAEGPPDELQVSLLRDLERAEDAMGEPTAALGHYDDALRIADDPRTLAEISIAKAQALSLLNRDEAVATLQRGLEALDGRDAELEQRIDAELIVHAFLSQDGRRLGLERLARYEGRVPDGPAAQAVLSLMAFGVLLSGGRAEEAALLAERALRTAGVRSGGFTVQVWALAAWTLAAADGAETAQALTEQELPASRREGHRREILAMETTIAYAAWRRGDLPTAVSRAETGLAISDPGAHQAWARGFKAAALLDAGDLKGVEHELAAPSPEHWAEPVRGSALLLYVRAQLRLEQGRLEEAAADLDDLHRREGLRGFHDIWRPAAVNLAIAAEISSMPGRSRLRTSTILAAPALSASSGRACESRPW